MIPKETRKKLLKTLLEMENDQDPESAHGRADEILLEILREEGGYDDIIEAYENVPKWYA